MTEENREYRTSQIMLRNQFHGKDKFKIPIIPKGNFGDKDFQNLLLIGFDRTNIRDEHHLNRMVHFFLYDYKFERIWKKPDYDIETVSYTHLDVYKRQSACQTCTTRSSLR